MSIESILVERSGGKCELCSSTSDLSTFAVEPSDYSSNQSAYVCQTCKIQLENPDKVEANHWRCLNDSMWNEEPAVKVLAYRMLTRLKEEGWPNDLLEMMYLEEENLHWAKAGMVDDNEEKHKDSNGVILEAGDTVVLIQDLNVKGGGFTAKRGTAVRRISLVDDNPEHIEGKVNDQRIVILTKYVKKSKP